MLGRNSPQRTTSPRRSQRRQRNWFSRVKHLQALLSDDILLSGGPKKCPRLQHSIRQRIWILKREEILADPDVRASWEALDDPEDREDLIDHLKALKRLEEGKDELVPWEEAQKRLGWT